MSRGRRAARCTARPGCRTSETLPSETCRTAPPTRLTTPPHGPGTSPPDGSWANLGSRAKLFAVSSFHNSGSVVLGGSHAQNGNQCLRRRERMRHRFRDQRQPSRNLESRPRHARERGCGRDGSPAITRSALHLHHVEQEHIDSRVGGLHLQNHERFPQVSLTTYVLWSATTSTSTPILLRASRGRYEPGDQRR